MVTADRGAQIVDLVAVRMARLVRSLEHVLEGGHVIIDVAAVANLDEWRKVVRRIAAARKWRVRTGVTPDGSRVWAIRLDRETTEQDRAVLFDRLGYLKPSARGHAPARAELAVPATTETRESSQAGATAPRESPLAVRT